MLRSVSVLNVSMSYLKNYAFAEQVYVFNIKFTNKIAKRQIHISSDFTKLSNIYLYNISDINNCIN